MACSECWLVCIVPLLFASQDGQEFLKLLLSKLELVFAASQQRVSRLIGLAMVAPHAEHTWVALCTLVPLYSITPV